MSIPTLITNVRTAYSGVEKILNNKDTYNQGAFDNYKTALVNLIKEYKSMNISSDVEKEEHKKIIAAFKALGDEIQDEIIKT